MNSHSQSPFKLSANLRWGIALNLWLLIMVIGTALLLVRWQYESRRLYVQLDKSDSVHKQLTSDNARLLAEKRQLSAPARIERTAAQSLGMRAADASVTVYADEPGPNLHANATVEGKP